MGKDTLLNTLYKNRGHLSINQEKALFLWNCRQSWNGSSLQRHDGEEKREGDSNYGHIDKSDVIRYNNLIIMEGFIKQFLLSKQGGAMETK